MCGGLDLTHLSGRAEALARRGLRVLALAGCSGDGDRIDAGSLVGGLTFLGLFGLIDPPRQEEVASVAECRAARIRVKMITALQILWIDLITGITVGLALAFELTETAPSP